MGGCRKKGGRFEKKRETKAPGGRIFPGGDW